MESLLGTRHPWHLANHGHREHIAPGDVPPAIVRNQKPSNSNSNVSSSNNDTSSRNNSSNSNSNSNSNSSSSSSSSSGSGSSSSSTSIIPAVGMSPPIASSVVTGVISVNDDGSNTAA